VFKNNIVEIIEWCPENNLDNADTIVSINGQKIKCYVYDNNIIGKKGHFYHAILKIGSGGLKKTNKKELKIETRSDGKLWNRTFIRGVVVDIDHKKYLIEITNEILVWIVDYNAEINLGNIVECFGRLDIEIVKEASSDEKAL